MNHWLTEGNKEWREKRRNEWSEYKGYFTDREIQINFQNITGLDSFIVECEENIELQLWIDNMVEKLLQRFEDLKLPENMNYFTILLKLGFHKNILNGMLKNEVENGPQDESNIIYHMTLDEVLESIIRYALQF
jgi:hypothetical protein